VEIKHQSQSNLPHPEPLDHGKLPHNMLHWENVETATASTAAPTGSKLAWKMFNRTNRWVPCIMQNFPSHSWDKPAQPLGRLIPPPKKNWITNSELLSSTTAEGVGTLKVHWRKGKGQEANLSMNYQ
jgi:hypothetical protein